MRTKSRAMTLGLSLLLASGLPAEAETTQIALQYAISSPHYPVVLRGADLPALLGLPRGAIQAQAVRQGQLVEIPVQIDARDRKGDFQIESDPKRQLRQRTQGFDENDECVFMAADAGEQLAVEVAAGNGLVELQLTDPHSGERRWVYFHEAKSTASRDYVRYDADNDVIETHRYRIGFARQQPFLLDQLRWMSAGAETWSPDYADTMKVRHSGKFLHQLEFVRNHKDYRSRLVAVKDGPVRVIRRTHNRVRIFWMIKTPVIEIDYLAYRDGFYMDTVLDMPFRIGALFSDVETYMSLDGRPAAGAIKSRIHSSSFAKGVAVDGTMSEQETAFNASGDQDFMLSTPHGDLVAALELEPDFPVRYQVHLQDNAEQADPPEQLPGLHGNVGFLTSNWEQLDTERHHMLFRVFFLDTPGFTSAMELLDSSPLLLH